MDISARLASLASKEAESTNERKIVEFLQSRFQQVSVEQARWDKIMYTSPEVNAQVDGYERRHNCGCCTDSPVEIFPFLELSIPPDISVPSWLRGLSDNSIRVYSAPACFRIGERNPQEGGDRAYPGWEAQLSKHGINQEIIERIALSFESHSETSTEAE